MEEEKSMSYAKKVRLFFGLALSRGGRHGSGLWRR